MWHGGIHVGLMSLDSWGWHTIPGVSGVSLVVRVVQSILQHPIVVSNNCGQLRVQIQ